MVNLSLKYIYISIREDDISFKQKGDGQSLLKNIYITIWDGYQKISFKKKRDGQSILKKCIFILDGDQ